MKSLLTTICCIVLAMTVSLGWISLANATSTYYTNNCADCHGTTPTTCGGCHGHGVHSSSAKNDLNLTGTTNKTSYTPGETVSVTINGGYRSGWVRAILYDQNMVEKSRSTGPTGQGGGASFPIILTAAAPNTAGTYTWNVAWYGNQYDASGAFFGPKWTPDPGNPEHGREIVSTNAFTVATAPVTSKFRVFRNGQWYVDMNGNGIWEPATDVMFSFGVAGDKPVTGHWSGAGSDNIGVFRNGQWYLDINGNGVWDSAIDQASTFGAAGDIPVTGDWNNTGTTKLGVFRNGQWYLDLNNNRSWDAATDALYTFGLPGDIPVTGDWNGNGTTKIGVFRNGQWYLDMNGNGVWDPATDVIRTFGVSGDIPVTGDWNGTGITNIGVFRNGQWYLDTNGNGVWDPATDTVKTFGVSGDLPVTGK